MNRRQLLLGSVGAGAALALGKQHNAAAIPRPTRPRALIQIFLAGGLDAGYTTDPKLRSEIDPKIVFPYGDSDILVRPKHRIGPFFAPLGPLVDRFAIVNGVECSTVAHPIGLRLIRQMRRTYVPGAPTFCSLVGQIAGEQRPLAEVRLMDPADTGGASSEDMLGFSPRTLSWAIGKNPGLWQRLWSLAHDGKKQQLVRAALREHAQRAGTGERASLNGTAALLEAMPDEPPPVFGQGEAEAALSGPLTSTIDTDAWGAVWNSEPTIAWLLKHRLTSTIFVDATIDWDSHYVNHERQRDSCLLFVPFLQRLLSTLDNTLTPEGLPLSSEVAVLVSSELGRFPIANSFGGKDHMPELPMLLAGPGITPGQYGETDRRMISTPISRATGKPGKRGAVPALEHMGSSVLSWFGERDPLRLGYLAEPLDFLFA